MATKNTKKNGAVATKKTKKKSASGGFPWLKALIALVLLGVLAGALGVGGMLWWYSRELPNLHSVEDYKPKQVTRVVDREGNVIASWTDSERLVRTVLPAEDIPDLMRQAIVSAEDSSYYKHGGLDFIGLLRAIYVNLRRGELSQGASTITQQVVKNLVLSPEKSIRRKVQEAILARNLDKNLSKDDVLNIYLNEVFFGVHFYGVEEASQYYFGKPAHDLQAHEAALIAGLVQSPNRYNPYRHPERALERRKYVLRRMYEEGHLQEGQYREALESPLGLVEQSDRRPYEGKFAYYVDALRRTLEAETKIKDLDTGGYRIVAAIDVKAQQAAEEAMMKGLEAFDARHGFHTPYRKLDSDQAVENWRKKYSNDAESQGLDANIEYRAVILSSDDDATILGIGPWVVSLDRSPERRLRPKDSKSWAEYFPPRTVFTVRPSKNYTIEQLSATDASKTLVQLLPPAQGAAVVMDVQSRELLAIVGGYSFRESPFNRAVQARRQTGSTFKAFVYPAALQARKITPATLLEDQPLTFKQPNGKNWKPANADGQFRGTMSVRTALALSRNVIAVQVLEMIGMEEFRQYLTQLGFEQKIPDNLTVALGSAELTPLEMTSTLAAYAGQGFRGKPVLVLDVFASDGQRLFGQAPQKQPGIDERVAWLATSMLRSVVERGTGRKAKDLPFQVAGKTGTTNDTRDAWFVGYTSESVATVWVGYDSNQSLGRGESGGATALPIWIDMMKAIHKGKAPAPFPQPPDGVTRQTIDEASGLLVRPGQRGVEEYFLQGTEPRTFAPLEGDSDVIDTLLRGGGAGNTEQPGFDDGGF